MPNANYLNKYTLTSAESMASTITSAALDIRYLDVAAVQFIWTGTPTGTFSIQASVDGSNWSTVTLSTSITASGSADSALVNMTDRLAFPYLRVVYTASSGAGNLTTYVTAKGN